MSKRSLEASLAPATYSLHCGPTLAMDGEVNTRITELLTAGNSRTATSLGVAGRKDSAFVNSDLFAQLINRKAKFVTADAVKCEYAVRLCTTGSPISNFRRCKLSGSHAHAVMALFEASRATLNKPELKAALVLAPLQTICKSKTTVFLAAKGVSVYRLDAQRSWYYSVVAYWYWEGEQEENETYDRYLLMAQRGQIF